MGITAIGFALAAGVLAPDISTDYLHELEHLAEIGRLSASLLHEINNPLTAAILWLEQYENKQSSCIRQARQSIDVLQRYVEAARRHIRRESKEHVFDIDSELIHVRRIMIPLARRYDVRLHVPANTNCQLYGDPVKFQQIIANLIKNAVDSYEPDPSVISRQKTVYVKTIRRRDYIFIKVMDTGCGIAGNQLEKIFQPFYSTKGRAGLGIGLFTIRRYVETDFRGSIQVTSSEGRGTCFTIKLPRAAKDAPVPLM